MRTGHPAISDLRPKMIDLPTTLRLAADLAIKHNQHLCDTFYHAVALESGVTLVTTDERYFAKARGEGSIVLFMDSNSPP